MIPPSSRPEWEHLSPLVKKMIDQLLQLGEETGEDVTERIDAAIECGEALYRAVSYLYTRRNKPFGPTTEDMWRWFMIITPNQASRN